MKKLLIILVSLILIQEMASASSMLQIQKLVDNSNVKVGDDVKIYLRFNNPFGKALPIKIVDKNVIGNSGLNIQCLEATIPPGESQISYQPIKPYAPGDYTLDPAQITYTNPDTGKEETVKTNSLKVSVTGSSQQGSAQGVTTIYRCNGINMQSTSYSSSGGSFSVNIGGGGTQELNQMFGQQSSPSNVQNNQLSQNSNIIKHEMERQFQQQEQTMKQFQKNIFSNKQFQQQNQKFLSSGYNATNTTFNPVTNSTGTFKITYRNRNGETATLKGEMENGTMKSIMSLTPEDKKRILEKLKQNKEYQKYNSELLRMGFNQSTPIFDQISQNYTRVTIPYRSKNGENEIYANYTNGTIRSVSIKDNPESAAWNVLWLIIIFLILGVVSYFLYKRFIPLLRKEKRHEESAKEMQHQEKKINYKKEARKMIEEAKKLFSEGKGKDAYEKVSQAVRFYFSYKLDIKREIVSSELLSILRKNKSGQYQEVKNCLNICGLVEFAKYSPNKKDFDYIISVAEKIVG
ncbi:MAG: hypothetical protein J7K87_01585 [Candidatus Aenigmarchaeota archaeon]|nr:hypothetical protein [Candidatus Aenigmarchaeota archaeon]